MSGHSSRGAVADRVRAALRGDDRLVVLHVAGVAGVGKTRLLKRLGDDAGAGARVLRVDFARVAATNAEAEQQLLSSYREILESLARGLSAPDLPARLREHQNEVGAGRATVDVARAEMRDAFLDAIGDDGPPILQLGDDLSSLTLNALAEWLLELLQGMSDRAQVVAVLTSRLPPRVEYPGRFERITLGELERDEAAAVLVEAGAGAWVDAVERWCGFYPAAVDVAASLARTAPDRPELLDDRRALEPWAARLVEPITTSLEVNDRAAVEAAAVLRTFDASLVRHALTYEGGDVRPDLEAWLGALPFVETLPDGRLRARPFLRLLLPERLRAEPPRRPHELGSRLTEIRAKVAAAYTQLVVGDAQGRSYRMWLTLEDRREQERQVEFVYHSVRTEYGPLDLAYVYFEAFWWWGAYVESDFCRRLPAVARAMLEEWRPDAVGDDAELLRRSEELVSALDAFAEATPPEKSGRPSDPAASLRAIGRIELLAGLERTPVGDQASHVHAILEIQRAAALQQRDLASGEVDASLGRARTLFGKSKGDAWCMPWVDVYEASLWAERGRQGKAAETATLGLTLAEKAAAADRDFEVEANLHMAIAECLDGRERPKALRHLARAVFCAYCFTSMPDLPDVYTQAFYGDIVGRALDRIREIPKPDDRRRACDGLLEFWSPYWELAGGEPAASGSVESLLERQSDDLALCLFPPGPSDDDLEQDGDYARTVEAVHERLDAEAAAARAFGDGGGLRGRLPGRRAGRAEEPAAAPALELPAEPPEPDDLFEPAGDPVWPDHWRTFPAAWRELADDRAREIVARAKADLPDTWREVLERRDVQGRSYEDVARGLGVSRADQTLMLGHARARIRRALAEHFEETG